MFNKNLEKIRNYLGNSMDKFPPTDGSWKMLLKTIYFRQFIFGFPSFLLVCSLFLAPIGIPFSVALWLWTIQYIFYTRQEFPPEKQYKNMIFAGFTIFPLTYIIMFYFPILALLYLLVVFF